LRPVLPATFIIIIFFFIIIIFFFFPSPGRSGDQEQTSRYERSVIATPF
jgi:hypothetical protein